MSDREIPAGFRLDVGRTDRGRTFVRVVYILTGRDRIQVGLKDADPYDVGLRLVGELINEIVAENTVL